MEYEDKLQLIIIEQKLDLLIKRVAPDLFEEETKAKPKGKTLKQLKDECEEEVDDDDELEQEEEPKPKKKRKLFGRR